MIQPAAPHPDDATVTEADVQRILETAIEAGEITIAEIVEHFRTSMVQAVRPRLDAFAEQGQASSVPTSRTSAPNRPR